MPRPERVRSAAAARCAVAPPPLSCHAPCSEHLLFTTCPQITPLLLRPACFIPPPGAPGLVDSMRAAGTGMQEAGEAASERASQAVDAAKEKASVSVPLPQQCIASCTAAWVWVRLRIVGRQNGQP